MEYIKKHLGQRGNLGREAHGGDTSFTEYVTCVKGRKREAMRVPWTCILGAYDRHYDSIGVKDYDYKIMRVPLVAPPLKKKAFEAMNPGHVLMPRPPTH
jgi:hypothetical protein